MKNRIIICATDLFRKYGIKGITMDIIAAKLKISKRTLYKHFSCKDELLSVCLQSHFEKTGFVPENRRSLFDEFIQLYYNTLHINQNDAQRFCRELHRYHEPVFRMLAGYISCYASACSRKVLSGIDEGLIRREINPAIIYSSVTGFLTRLLCNTGYNENSPGTIPSPDLVVIFSRGIATVKGRNYFDQKLKEISKSCNL